MTFDLSRIVEFLTGAFLRLDEMIAAGDAKLAALVAEGEARVSAAPELRPEWEQQRAKLEAGWLEARAALVEARDNPEVRTRLASGVAEALETLLKGSGEVGKPHGHAG